MSNASGVDLSGDATGRDDPPPLGWTPSLTKKFWNYYSRFPDTYFTEQFGPGILEAVLPLFGQRPRVLDYGCGSGALTGQLLDHGIDVAACDLSPDSLHKVQQRYAGNPHFIGALKLDEVENVEPFDVAMLVELVEHVEDSTLRHIFADLRRVIKPTGMVVITTPNAENLAVDTVYCPNCDHTFHRWQHVRSWSAESLGQFLLQQGFEPVKTLTMDLSLTLRDGRLRYIVKRFVSRLLQRKLPHLVVVARCVAL